ncbi:MAG: hypothetical protein QM790_16745 [Nibricoccus sp.]
MPYLPPELLLPAFKVEGGVNVFKNSRGSYEVSFRIKGKQWNRKLGTRKKAEARAKAAAVFASVVRAERDEAEARTLERVFVELADLKQLVRSMVLYPRL